MKTVAPIKRILAGSIFISGVVFYLFFSIIHPLLHNHTLCIYSKHQSGQHHKNCSSDHHPNCPACNFLAIASFSTVPQAAIILTVLFRIIYRISFDYKQSCRQPLCNQVNLMEQKDER